jgi:hypothetical protein
MTSRAVTQISIFLMTFVFLFILLATQSNIWAWPLFLKNIEILVLEGVFLTCLIVPGLLFAYLSINLFYRESTASGVGLVIIIVLMGLLEMDILPWIITLFCGWFNLVAPHVHWFIWALIGCFTGYMAFEIPRLR